MLFNLDTLAQGIGAGPPVTVACVLQCMSGNGDSDAVQGCKSQNWAFVGSIHFRTMENWIWPYGSSSQTGCLDPSYQRWEAQKSRYLYSCGQKHGLGTGKMHCWNAMKHAMVELLEIAIPFSRSCFIFWPPLYPFFDEATWGTALTIWPVPQGTLNY